VSDASRAGKMYYDIHAMMYDVCHIALPMSYVEGEVYVCVIS
jgi:hypothetical protein